METEFGRYLLTERLGTGSLTEAYRAKSFGVEGFEKGIVVKRVLSNRAALPGLIEAFVEHAKASLTLSHANVVQVIDLGKLSAEIPGEPKVTEHTFIATELVDGVDLKILLQQIRDKRVELPVGHALFIAAEIAKALDHAHKRRTGAVIHGPLTPQSVLVSWEGEVKVSDFGIHQALMAVRFEPDEERTLPYLSPEQVESRALGKASDVFSLGTLLFELLTGEALFRGENRESTRDRILSGSARAPSLVRASLSPEVDKLCAKMLFGDPERRISDAGALHEEIVALGYSLGVSPSPVEVSELVSRLCRRSEGAPRNEDDLAMSIGEVTPAPATTLRAEKREATLLVVSGLGPTEERSEVLRRVEKAGGVVLSSDAAEARAVFGIVEADGRDTEAAVDVALALVEAMPELGVGVDLGRVTVDDRGAVVSDVDLASGFAVAARNAHNNRGRVHLTRAALRVVEREIEVEVDPEHADSFTATKRRSELLTSRFVGRRNELGRIGERFAESLRGQQISVFLSGERGIGKTRLLRELERRLAKLPSGARLYRARCPRDLTGSPTPLGAVSELVRSLLAVVERGGAVDEAEASASTRKAEADAEIVRRLRLLGFDETDTNELVLLTLDEASVTSEDRAARALGKALERLARDRAVVVALDDLQFLDAASARVLRIIALEHAAARVLWIFVDRKSAPQGWNVEEIALGPLSESEVAVLAAALLGARVLPPELVHYLLERAEGNPLLVELIVKELADSALVTVRQGVAEVDLERASVPRTLRALIEGRLARLDAGIEGHAARARDMLRALALLGDGAAVDEIAAFLEVPVERARSLLAEPGVEALAPSGKLHGGIAEVILETIPQLERNEAHARAALLVERLGEPSGPRLDRVALHLSASGNGAAAAAYFARAAMLHGASAKAPRADLAARSAARALAAADTTRVSANDLCAWLGVLGDAVVKSRARVAFSDTAPGILERIDADGDIRQRVEARLDVARIASVEGSFEEAEVVLAQARDLATEPELRARALAAEVEIAERAGEIERGCEAARALLAMGGSIDARVLLDAAALFAAHLDLDEASRAIDTAYEIGLGDSPLLRASVEVRRARALLISGDASAAQRVSLLAADLASAHELQFDVASARLTLAEAYTALGRRERAYAAYVEALESSLYGGFERLAVLSRAGLAYLEGLEARVSKSANAPSVLARLAQETEARGLPTDALRIRLLLGKLHASRGRVDEARTELAKTEKGARDIGHLAVARDAASALEALG